MPRMRPVGGVFQGRHHPEMPQLRASSLSIPIWISGVPHIASMRTSAWDLPPELLAQKEDLLKDRVAIEMKRYFKSDFKRIGHATRVARYAETDRQGRKGQSGGNPVLRPICMISAFTKRKENTAARPPNIRKWKGRPLQDPF